MRELDQSLASVDVLITPTAPMTAPPLDSAESEFDRARQFTLPFSVAGLPAISIPCGFAETRACRSACRSAGPRLGEALVLRIAGAYEGASR